MKEHVIGTLNMDNQTVKVNMVRHVKCRDDYNRMCRKVLELQLQGTSQRERPMHEGGNLDVVKEDIQEVGAGEE